MRKVILTLVAAALAAGSAFAQIGVGAGYLNLNTKTTIGDNSTNGNASGFYVGGDYSYDLGSGFAVMPGIYYSMTTSKGDILGAVETRTDTHSLSVPVHFAYGVDLGYGVKVFPFAGPHINFGLASNTITGIGNTSTKFDNYSDDGNINRFNLALAAGVGVDILETVRIKFAYNWGLLDLHQSDDVKLTNTNWQIGAAFLF